jgi:pyridinium-3,5-bisthiocarboxylic acid mononucleotide nickel chelatase
LSKILYIDCFSGISGDMVLGALLDLGLPLDELRRALGSLAIDHGTIASEPVLRSGVSATKFRVLEPEPAHVHHHVSEHHGHHYADHGHHQHDHADGSSSAPAHHGPPAHHSLKEIGQYIDRSALSAGGKSLARDMFRRLAEAEAAIHKMPLERVHLHEVGAVDSIIDIVGAVFGMEWLGATEIVSSPVNVGSGNVRCAHGVFPVPAPATTRLLQGVPIYSDGPAKELTTPTGALLVTTYAREFGSLPPMTISQTGYGAGDADFAERPNVLRLIVGESESQAGIERIVTIECEIDDMNPQLFGPLMDRLYGAGALDVYYAPVQMKKNRPGTLVTVIAPPEKRYELSGILFTDTTTIGVRYQEMHRERLDREMRTLDTPVGRIRFKIARREGRLVNAAPEFEDCARIAGERRLPIKDVQAIATKSWLEQGE